MTDNTCCKRLRIGDVSPFEIVMLGWYDGLHNGMASCRTCGLAYNFEMLAWDSERETRIYGFRQVSRGSYDAIAVLAALPSPEPAQLRDRLDKMAVLLRDSLASSLEWNLYIKSTDLSKEILTAKYIDFSTWNSILSSSENGRVS